MRTDQSVFFRRRDRRRPGRPRWLRVALLAVLSGGAGAGEGDRPGPAATSAPPGTFPVEVLAGRDARVPAEVSGRVVRRLQDESASVKKGEAVVWLDDALLAAGLRTAEAEVRQARAQKEWADLDLKRQKLLRDRESVQLAEYDRAEIAVRRTGAALEAAEARAAEARTRLERTVIRAPFAGKLVRIHPQQGEYLRAGTTAFRIIDDSELRIVAYVAAGLLPHLRPGGVLEVRSDLAGLPALRARVFSVAPGAEGRSRRFRVEAHVKDPSGRWRPGMTAEARPAGPARKAR
ncbi:MAG: efflux RND transporter periplasmic adaptor subunit [Planctomycetota bacterium]